MNPVAAKNDIAIPQGPIADATVRVPGSKSDTHRTVIAAALANGTSVIGNALDSDDTRLTLNAVTALGARVNSDDAITITGTGGRWRPCPTDIYLGNSGTSMRLLTAVAALGSGRYRLTGSRRMCERPIQHLLDGLRQIGVDAVSVNENGCPPIDVITGAVTGGSIGLNCSDSSQYLSGLLLMAPCTPDGLDIRVVEGPVSRPYIDLTIAVMARFGIRVITDGYEHFHVDGSQQYRPGTYTVAPDASQAGYFWAAAAVTGATVKVHGVTADAIQGDVRLAAVFESMGCRVTAAADGIAVTGGPLRGITVDMSDMPDMVPTLAVVAAHADGRTVIENVGHLRIKESDRLASVARELNRMGIVAETTAGGLVIEGGRPKGAVIRTYDDHRMAMSFAVAGLVTDGVRISDPDCVNKSFPNFWKVFSTLYP